MTTTDRLGLPLLAAGQAQKHVTHNEALLKIDDLVQSSVLSRSLSAPPSSPSEGDRYIVGPSPTGLWASQVNKIALFRNGAWSFYAPFSGYTVFVTAENALLVFDGAEYHTIANSGQTALQNLQLLGINTTADSTNPIAAKINKALFAASTIAEGGTGNLQYTLSKETSGGTLSFLFQTNYSARAELGLIASDDFLIKTSANGSSYKDGLRISKDTGAVTFPNGITALNNGPLAGNRNCLINGDMRINQRGSLTAVDDAYCFDRWYTLTQSGAVTISGQSNIAVGWPQAIRLTQPDSTAKRFGLAQIIEAQNCVYLRGCPVTLSAKIRSSNATNIRLAILEWTGSADIVTSDIVNDWTNGSYSTGQFFIASNLIVTATATNVVAANTATTISVDGVCGNNLNNLIVMIWCESAQAQTTTIDIGDVQLEIGPRATPFERRPVTTELSLCQRYFWRKNCATNMAVAMLQAFGSTSAAGSVSQFPTEMRASPTATLSALSHFYCTTAAFGLTGSLSSLSFSSINTQRAFTNGVTISSGALTAGNATMLYGGSGAYIDYAAEL